MYDVVLGARLISCMDVWMVRRLGGMLGVRWEGKVCLMFRSVS